MKLYVFAILLPCSCHVFAMLLPCFIVCVCKCCKKVTYVYVCYVCMIGPLLSHIAHRPVPSPPSFSFLQLPSWICPRRFASVKDCQTWILASREVRPQSHHGPSAQSWKVKTMSAETLDEREICAFHQRSLAWMTGEMKQVVEWTTGDFDQVPTQAKAHDPQAEATQGKKLPTWSSNWRQASEAPTRENSFATLLLLADRKEQYHFTSYPLTEKLRMMPYSATTAM